MNFEEPIEIRPQGWIHPIKIGGVGYCGQANPGVSFHIYDGSRWWGGAITTDQAETLARHLNSSAEKAKGMNIYELLPQIPS